MVGARPEIAQHCRLLIMPELVLLRIQWLLLLIVASLVNVLPVLVAHRVITHGVITMGGGVHVRDLARERTIKGLHSNG